MFLQSSDLERCAKTEIESFEKFHHPNILSLISFVKREERMRSSGSSFGSSERSGAGGGSSNQMVQVMYLLFPLIENGSLRNILNRRERQILSSRPKLREILTDFTAICEALNVLHTFQPAYVHQDIKPEVRFCLQCHSVLFSYHLFHSVEYFDC
jgi:serine/threonine protein kinase